MHKLIKENYQTVFYEKESQGVILPFHLKREFKKYLTCGILAHGFARFHCDHCQKDKLVPFSCKGRTICPSCNGRRMADTAKHLMENVIPKVPIRQWVLSMPYKHRFLLASHNKLVSSVLAIIHRAISTFYLKKAKTLGLKRPQVGAIDVIQRFGGALNLNFHYHIIFLDGVCHEENNGKLSFKELRPTDDDIVSLIEKIKTRINRSLEKKGFLENLLTEEVLLENVLEEDPALLSLKSESVQNRVDGFNKPMAIGKRFDAAFVELKGRLCASLDGFSLHANVRIGKYDREAKEKLCRYILRGPLPLTRISMTRDGNALLKLKAPYTDGTTHLVFTPEQFIKRIIALIPLPRTNLIRYFGILGARSKKRNKVIPKNKDSQKKKKVKVYRTPWAELLKYVFKIDVGYCEHCGKN